MSDFCPRCKQKLSTEPRRICNECKEPIGKNHKWFFKTEKDTTFIVHRNCSEPEKYLKKELSNE